jgi:hypothetical protein
MQTIANLLCASARRVALLNSQARANEVERQLCASTDRFVIARGRDRFNL